jgi:formate hydrogenlyase subunit 6/NADH:ubiquinone oxidoreductase subunit I
MGSYFKDLYSVSKSILIGMGITLRYFFHPIKNCITIQYPHEHDEIPLRHRGIHYLETERCIMCFMCSKACPVNCIQIEGSRDGDLVYGYTGKKASISRFTIDYGRCIFCNLCVEPCPEDCIHMQPVSERPHKNEFDFSNTSRRGMIKNLLTDAIYSDEDHHHTQFSRIDIKELARKAAEEKKRVAAEKKAAQDAATASGASSETPAS